ncbi:MAG: hypothetical protein OXB88_02905 [Bacteriovoracales bacterium]|nr:hypothetical protein [Bacteriovoracales bacterium]
MSPRAKKTGDQDDLHTLSEEELGELGLERHEIWYLMVNEIPCGPYSLDNLKSFLENHKDFDHQTQASSGDKQKWAPLSKYPFFDRRSLGNPDSPLGTQTEEAPLKLLIDGRPQGPYEQKEILKKLESKEILPTNLVSADGGKSWFPLYRHPRFDRRNRPGHGELPDRPNQESSEKRDQGQLHGTSNPHLTAQSDQKNSQKEFLQLLSLASNQNPLPQQDKHVEQLDEAIESTKKMPLESIATMGVASIALIALIFMASPKTQKDAPAPKVVTEARPSPKPTRPTKPAPLPRERKISSPPIKSAKKVAPPKRPPSPQSDPIEKMPSIIPHSPSGPKPSPASVKKENETILEEREDAYDEKEENIEKEDQEKREDYPEGQEGENRESLEKDVELDPIEGEEFEVEEEIRSEGLPPLGKN